MRHEEISIEVIQYKVSRHYDIRLADMTGKRRKRQIAFPRQIAMYLSRQLTENSFSTIGKVFGGRSRSTVINACRLVKERIETDANVGQIIHCLEKQLMASANHIPRHRIGVEPIRTQPKSEKAAVKKTLREHLDEETAKLLSAANRRLPELKALLSSTSDHWGYEDPIYRFYHQSFKVYHLQAATLKIVTELRALAPHLKLNPFFWEIVAEGTGKTFKMSHNANWLKHTRPIVEAFFHARHMLVMICQYAEELQEPPSILPSGWATVLYLYDMR